VTIATFIFSVGLGISTAMIHAAITGLEKKEPADENRQFDGEGDSLGVIAGIRRRMPLCPILIVAVYRQGTRSQVSASSRRPAFHPRSRISLFASPMDLTLPRLLHISDAEQRGKMVAQLCAVNVGIWLLTDHLLSLYDRLYSCLNAPPRYQLTVCVIEAELVA
jgi:hypothetical protein